MSENMQFPIPNSVLEPYIKSAVSTAITAALGDGVKLVEIAVQNALTEKVGSSGKRESYSNDHVFVEVMAKNKIQEVAKQVIMEMAEAMRPNIKAAVEKQISTKHKEIAKVLVDSLITSLTSSWNISVNIDPAKKDKGY